MMELYQVGSEGPEWWVPYPDQAALATDTQVTDRCNATKPARSQS